jgi:hypothetical protein
VSEASRIYWNPPAAEEDGTLADANGVLAAISTELQLSPPLSFTSELKLHVVVPGIRVEDLRRTLDSATPDWRALGIGVCP